MNWSSNDRLARHPTIWLARLTLLVVVLTTTVAEAQRIGSTIYVINRDGTGLRDLLPDLDRHKHVPGFSQPCWSPDGRQIAFNVYYWGATPGFSMDLDPEVMVVDTVGGEPRLLGDGSNPDWSPDGRRIAFTGDNTGVYLMNADGSGREELLSFGAHAPKFSPDGRGFLYSTKNSVLGIAVEDETRYFDLKSGTSRRIDVTLALCYRGITSSPDGKWIVGMMTGRNRGLAIVSMDPENCRTVTVSLAGSLYHGPTYGWSPDGKTILCAMATKEQRRLQIHSFPVPDLDQPQATVQPTWFEGQDPKRSNFEPAWSSDGERIVFVSTRAG